MFKEKYRQLQNDMQTKAARVTREVYSKIPEAHKQAIESRVQNVLNPDPKRNHDLFEVNQATRHVLKHFIPEISAAPRKSRFQRRFLPEQRTEQTSVHQAESNRTLDTDQVLPYRSLHETISRLHSAPEKIKNTDSFDPEKIATFKQRIEHIKGQLAQIAESQHLQKPEELVTTAESPEIGFCRLQKDNSTEESNTEPTQKRANFGRRFWEGLKTSVREYVSSDTSYLQEYNIVPPTRDVSSDNHPGNLVEFKKKKPDISIGKFAAGLFVAAAITIGAGVRAQKSSSNISQTGKTDHVPSAEVPTVQSPVTVQMPPRYEQVNKNLK